VYLEKNELLTKHQYGSIYYAGPVIILLCTIQSNSGEAMDKEVLAVIGKLYLDIFSLNNYVESLKARVSELENQLALQANKKDK